MRVPPTVLNPLFRVNAYSVSCGGGATGFLVLRANPNRVGLVLSSDATTQFRIWPDNTVSGSKGILIGVGAVPTILIYSEIGPLVGGEWWVQSMALFICNFVETIFGGTIDPTSYEG